MHSAHLRVFVHCTPSLPGMVPSTAGNKAIMQCEHNQNDFFEIGYLMQSVENEFLDSSPESSG